MKLTDFCIKRPVFSTVLSLIIFLVGLVTFQYMYKQVRHYPRVDSPRISVSTQFEGASPDIIESQVTKPIEDVLSGIEGVDKITSTSDQGESRVDIHFHLSRKIEDAANDVREAIGRLGDRLPSEAKRPEIRKARAESSGILTLVLTSDQHTTGELSDYAQRNIENLVETVPGVAKVDTTGGGNFEMHIQLDPRKMVGFEVTAEDVAQAIKQQNFEKPAGKIRTEDREISVTTKASLRTESEFNNVIVREKDGYLVRLKDIGQAQLYAMDEHFRVNYNGQDAIAIDVVKQSVANPLTIANEIKDRILPRVKENLPTGMEINVAYDSTKFIERSIEEVYETIFIAAGLVILVILAFLRSFRAALVPVVTIPLSLVGAFMLMWVAGFTINVLTLLALVMAIGMVVDDAIVMLENIYRHIEEGMHPLKAAFKGAREISFAVIGMTITLAAVYAPIALVGGMIGRVFTEFALTLAGSVILSGVIALTLSPAMCGRLLKPHKKASGTETGFSGLFRRWDEGSEKALNQLDQSYSSFLKKLMDTHYFRLSVVAGGLAISLGGYYLATKVLKSELTPQEDSGVVFSGVYPPKGASLDYVNRYTKKVADILKDVPEIEKRLTIVNVPGRTSIMSTLLPWEERVRSGEDIVNSIKPKLADITGVHASSIMGRVSLFSDSERPVEIVIQGSNKSIEELEEVIKSVSKILRATESIKEGSIYSTELDRSREYAVVVDREKAGTLGIDVKTVGETLKTLIGGQPVSAFKKNGQRYYVKIELPQDYRRTAEDIKNIYIRGQRKNKNKEPETLMVSLAEVVKIKERFEPIMIQHFNGMRAVNVSAALEEGYGLGDTLIQLQTAIKRVLPDGMQLDFDGESRRYFEESQNVLMVFLLALAFIYLVLSAQYESFIDPLIIMFSVPLSLAGGLFALWVSGGSLNIFSQIGLVTLIGLITKHGILIVDFANNLIEKGKDRSEAIIEACNLRLRPILMTTLAMVVGAIPLALANGAGQESRQEIGWVIVGGMTFGTFFTLFVVPIVYYYLSTKKKGSLEEYYAQYQPDEAS